MNIFKILTLIQASFLLPERSYTCTIQKKRFSFLGLGNRKGALHDSASFILVQTCLDLLGRVNVLEIFLACFLKVRPDSISHP